VRGLIVGFVLRPVSGKEAPLGETKVHTVPRGERAEQAQRLEGGVRIMGRHLTRDRQNGGSETRAEEEGKNSLGSVSYEAQFPSTGSGYSIITQRN